MDAEECLDSDTINIANAVFTMLVGAGVGIAKARKLASRVLDLVSDEASKEKCCGGQNDLRLALRIVAYRFRNAASLVRGRDFGVKTRRG